MEPKSSLNREAFRAILIAGGIAGLVTWSLEAAWLVAVLLTFVFLLDGTIQVWRTAKLMK